jgi:UDP-N-acetylmuramoylalanine--D-glutamate ligase
MQTASDDNQQLRTLVVGLGVTGLSVARYLLAQGVRVAITDSRENPPGLDQLQAEYPDLGVFLGGFDDAVFEQADLLVLSPGVPLATPQVRAAVARGVIVVGDVELFARAAKAPVVAITGSNGKSTVTTLVGEMARAAGRKVAVGGNLGTPALDLLSDDVELYVLELSSFQLETTSSLQAAVAAVLNVQPDHMDRYPDIETYADAKARVFQGAGLGIYNADDPRVMGMQGSDSRWLFTLGQPQDNETFGLRVVDGHEWLCRGTQALLPANALLIPGRHNLANALAAMAIGVGLGIELDVMVAVLGSFRGLPHRTEFVAEINDVRWYNDSKATNVGAAHAALEGMHQGDDSRAVVILGGDCKGAEFDELSGTLAECARAVVLIGRDAEQIRAVVPSVCEVAVANTMEQAVARAAELAQPGDHVLLSPACASFDMFRNFAERGDVFRATVRRFLG